MLIEVTRIDSGGALPTLLNKIVDVLVERLKFPRTDAYSVAIAISEIGQNTFDHNEQSETCGFLAMQVYEGQRGRFLEIGVADYGDGLGATLRRNPKYGHISDDLAAIECATDQGTSEYDDRTRGTGLYHLLEIAYEHEGVVQIRSGTGKVRYRMDKRRGWSFRVPRMPGVQIALELSAKAA